MEALESGQQEVKRYFDDPQVTTFVLLVHSAPSNRIRFMAQDVPGFGYCTYWIQPKTGPNMNAATQPAAQQNPAQLNRLARKALPLVVKIVQNPRLAQWMARPKIDSHAEIENEFFRVSASPEDGVLTVQDKRNGAVFTGLNRFVDGGDGGDEYNFCPPKSDLLVRVGRVRRLEVTRGALRQSIEIELKLPVPRALAPDRKRSLIRFPSTPPSWWSCPLLPASAWQPAWRAWTCIPSWITRRKTIACACTSRRHSPSTKPITTGISRSSADRWPYRRITIPGWSSRAPRNLSAHSSASRMARSG